jgi:hypothetical protein
MKSRHRLIFSMCLALLSGTGLSEKLGRHSDSELLFKRALGIYEKAAGPEHPAVATLANNLGQVAAEDRSEARPRRGAAAGHAGLSQ